MANTLSLKIQSQLPTHTPTLRIQITNSNPHKPLILTNTSYHPENIDKMVYCELS